MYARVCTRLGRILVVAGVGLAAASSAFAATATFSAAADARVDQANPTKNYGGSYLATRGGTLKEQTVLRFAVSGLTGPVTAAKLRLWATVATADGPAVYATTTTWVESTVTWNNKPAAVGAASDDVLAVKANTWIEWNVAPLVTGNGTVAFLLAQPNGVQAIYAAREATAAQRPQLVVTYSTNPCAGVADGTACSDGNPCTTGDACLAGVCSPGVPTSCDDLNPCTTDACGASGCTHAANTALCDDGNACTTGDVCGNGVCAGTALNCDDANVCTVDTCQAGTCLHAAGTGSCDADGNACTIDTCQSGTCAAGPPKNCDDGNACTIDTCTPATGNCAYAPASDPACGVTPGTLIARGASWKYLDDGSNQGTAWVGTLFDDSTWKNGLAELGYGGNDEATVVSFGPNASKKYTTTWFRRTFGLPGLPGLPLMLHLHAIDGAVVYVNGTEVYRLNMPNGNIGFQTAASSAVADETYHDAAVPVSVLIAGMNTIAVEVHRSSPSGADLSFDLSLDGGCAKTQAVETLCNGIVADCDGMTDWLMPTTENACSTGLPGACGPGYGACLDGAWTCLAPPPVTESYNGLDDNCDGMVDNVPQGAVVPLNARVAVPPYMWTDSPGLVDAVLEQMQHIGLRATGPTAATGAADWPAVFGELSQHAIVFFPGYVLDTSVSATQLAQLTAWVQAGGVLIMGKPSGATLQNLAGLATVTNHSDATRIRVTPTAPATLWLDSPEERDILLSTDPTTVPVSIQTYTLVAGSGATSFGKALAGQVALGDVFVRRALGQGAVYSLGYDPLVWGSVRCYVNCFDPGKDVLAMLLKAIAREAMQGHYVLKHTAPGLHAGVQLVSHDTCAPDTWTTGTWGAPGGTRMATMEQALGVHASYMIQTDYVEGWFVPSLLATWLSLGARVDGLHTVQHFDMSAFALGNCAVTQATYNTSAPTLCGEIVVNQQIVNALLPQKTTAFRAPYLVVNNQQFDVLAGQGIALDGSFGLGDVRTAFPISAAREPSLAWKTNHQPVFTFPMVQEDGLGAIVANVATRTELQSANEAQFLTRWKYSMLQNMRNEAWSTMLVHPSYGQNVPVDNLQTKIDSVQAFLVFAQAQDVILGDFTSLGNFWRARDGVQIDATWDPLKGYAGTITVGTLAAPNVTLEFGDAIARFSCPDCGPVQTGGNRVTLVNPLAAGAKVAFQAAP